MPESGRSAFLVHGLNPQITLRSTWEAPSTAPGTYQALRSYHFSFSPSDATMSPSPRRRGCKTLLQCWISVLEESQLFSGH